MSKRRFLTAEWRKLIMANYETDPAVLKKYLPYGTELDTWDNKYYISLVGFMFLKTRLLGVPIPFHTNFPEVNLRFYVRYKEAGEWKRGVVFIKEIVPKPALSFVANTVFKERYSTMRMKYKWADSEKNLLIRYEWKHKRNWSMMEVIAGPNAIDLVQGSKQEFITEHFWGYTNINDNKTGEYKVAHPGWKIYPVTNYTVNCDFKSIYGNDFEALTNSKPSSVFLAEGSPVEIFSKRIL